MHEKLSSTALSVQDNVNTLEILSLEKKTIIYVLLIVVNSFLQTYQYIVCVVNTLRCRCNINALIGKLLTVTFLVCIFTPVAVEE